MCDAAQPDTAGPLRFCISGEFRLCITGGKNDVSTIKDPDRNAARLRSRRRAGVICTNPLIDSLDERYRGLSATRAGLRPRRVILAQKDESEAPPMRAPTPHGRCKGPKLRRLGPLSTAPHLSS
jgi:hypothetical protein